MATSYTTTSRKHMLDYLMDNCERTVTISDISNYLKEMQCEVNITTIYRYMDKLVSEQKVIKYVAEKGKQATFQYVDNGRHCTDHLHLQCIRCGSIVHLECEFMTRIAEHIKQDHAFEIQCKNSIIYGYCEACRTADS